MRITNAIEDLRQQIHDDLRRQHPEWVLPNGDCPMCAVYEARLIDLLALVSGRPRRCDLDCNGTLIRLRINPGDNSWLVVERKGNEWEYIDIKESEIESVMKRFDAIDRDPQRFAAFVDSMNNC